MNGALATCCCCCCFVFAAFQVVSVDAEPFAAQPIKFARIQAYDGPTDMRPDRAPGFVVNSLTVRAVEPFRGRSNSKQFQLLDDEVDPSNCSCHLLQACQASDYTLNYMDPDNMTCSCAETVACQEAATAPAENECSNEDQGNYNLDLHIGALFAVLSASLLGAMIPLLSKYLPQFSISPFLITLGKCMGNGVVLACALIHMIQPASQSLISPCVPKAFNEDYPAYAFLFAMVAALVMHCIEFVAEWYAMEMVQKQVVHTKSPSSLELVTPAQIHIQAETPVNAASHDTPQHATVVEPTSFSHNHCHDGHVHSVLLIDGMRKTVAAYLLEFGITVHSVFIGLQNGVVNEDELKTLLVALCFHQFFEGVALGARLLDANFSLLKEIGFALVFSLASPIGIAIGIAVTTSLNPNGATYLLIQGTLDAVCGGILLYIGFVLLLKDFPADQQRFCRNSPQPILRTGAMFACLWIGAGMMAFIGKYL